jgi:hypothetical protein
MAMKSFFFPPALVCAAAICAPLLLMNMQKPELFSALRSSHGSVEFTVFAFKKIKWIQVLLFYTRTACSQREDVRADRKQTKRSKTWKSAKCSAMDPLKSASTVYNC